MSDSLRITIADDEPRIRDFLWRCLENLGHQVVSAARTGPELVEQCRQHQPDLVISDVKMPELDGIDAAEEIYRFTPVPVILISAFHDDELIERAAKRHVLAYLVKPIKQSDLGPAIAVAMRRYREFNQLRKESDDLKQAMEDRKTIEKAKGVVMRRTGLSEADAFRRLQKLASSKSQKLVEVARMILTAEEAVGEE